MKKRILIFCSSSNEVSPMYFAEAEKFATELVNAGYGIVYGGACLGLMGCFADTAMKLGGEVVGVIPEYFHKPGIVHEGLSELVVVDNLLDRKQKMLSLADAAVAFPGGLGTIDEITEVMVLKQLKEHNKPVFFHNFLNFWDPLLEYFEELRSRRMISQDLSQLMKSVESTSELMGEIKKCCPIG